MDILEILVEIKEGSRAAQKLLFDTTADRMMTVCCRYVKRREDAEEILLNGFFKAYRHLPAFQYQSDAAFYAWLKKLMVNECLMFLRKKHVFMLEADLNTEEVSLDNDALSRLSAASIHAMILQLPIGYRTVFNLYELEGYNHAEIAGLLAISTGTSKSQLSKAKSMLQKMIIQKENYYARQQSK